MARPFSSLAHSSYRRRIVECKAVAYSSRLPSRARPPALPRIAASSNNTPAHGIDSSIITIQTMTRWETLNHMAYKFGSLGKSDGKLALKILNSIVERSEIQNYPGRKRNLTYIFQWILGAAQASLNPHHHRDAAVDHHYASFWTTVPPPSKLRQRHRHMLPSTAAPAPAIFICLLSIRTKCWAQIAGIDSSSPNLPFSSFQKSGTSTYLPR